MSGARTDPAVGAEHLSTPRWAWIVVTVGLIAAGYWMWSPSLVAEGLSDDLLLPSMFGNRDPDGLIRPNWNQLWTDLTGSWVGLDAPLWRPMLSLSFLCDLAMAGGGAPWAGAHYVNLSLHVTTASVAASAAGTIATIHCGRALPRFAAPTVGAAAGAFVLLHPVSTEPVCWLAARNSGLEVFFRTIAWALYAIVVLRRSRLLGSLTGTLCLAAAACAIATKETGVLVLVGAAWIECCGLRNEPGRTTRAALGRASPLIVLVAAYFALRVVLFGTPLGNPGGTAVDGGLDLLAANVLDKAFTVAWPWHDFRSAAGIAAAGIALFVGSMLTGTAVAGAAPADKTPRAASTREARHTLLVTAAGFIALTVCALPTWNLPLSDGLIGSRTVYGSLPFGAWILVAATARTLCGTSPWTARVATLGALLYLLGLTMAATTQRTAYEQAWREIAATITDLERVRETASPTPTSPLVLVTMPKSTPNVPVLNENAWFALTQEPATQPTVPTVALGYVGVEVPLAETLFLDAGAARAAREAGCSLALWIPDAGKFRVLTPPVPTASAAPTGSVRLVRAGGGVDGPWGTWQPRPRQRARWSAPLSAEAVELTPPPPRPVTVIWNDATGRLLERIPVAAGTRRVDLTRSPTILAAAAFGGRFGSLTLLPEPDSADSAPDTPWEPVVSLIARLPVLAWPLADGDTRSSAPVDLLSTDPRGWSRAPDIHDAGPATELRMLVLGPHSALPVPVEPGQPVRLPEAVHREFSVWSRLADADHALVWFERLDSGVRTARSRPVAVRLTPRGR